MQSGFHGSVPTFNQAVKGPEVAVSPGWSLHKELIWDGWIGLKRLNRRGLWKNAALLVQLCRIWHSSEKNNENTKTKMLHFGK